MLLQSTLDSFQNTFKNQLSKMLSPDELGSFILVLANSMQDKQLQASLNSALQQTFEALKKNENIKAGPDDIAVLEALKKEGIAQYGAWQSRKMDHWQCAYNPLRALRPERSSQEVFNGLQRPFDESNFHFSKPFLKPEILSEESFDNTPLQVMYHKFPFIPYHLLIVIEAAKHRAQYLAQKDHSLTWNLAKQVAENIPSFGLAFNSLGAGASVNQLHIHAFIEESLAVEQALWQHNGGNESYPLQATRFESKNESWDYIESLHQQSQPYNLLYRSGLCYVITRKPQGSITLPEWLPSIGWYEACGGFNLSNEEHFSSLTTDSIYSMLHSYK